MIRSTNLALLLVCLCQVSTGAADTATVISDTPLYQRPSIESSILGSVKAGSQVETLARHGGWKQISRARTNGWVRSYQLRPGIISVDNNDTSGSGGFFSSLASLSRKASGLFSSDKRDYSFQSTATIGVRGLSEQQIKNARPDYAQLKKLQSFRSNKNTTRAFASNGKLKPIKLAHMPKSEVEE